MMVTQSDAPICSPSAALEALQSSDNQIRYYAAWWLGKHQVESACVPLCEALADEAYRTPQGGYPLRRQAARALGQLKNPQATPALIAALKCEEDLQLRAAAAEALGAIGDDRAVPHLVALLQSGREQPLEALIEALGSLQVWSVREQIESFLNHPSERVQCAAARYLYLLTQEPQYIERIVRNLSHDNAYLRWSAAFDLGAIGHLSAAKAIQEAKIANSLKLLNMKRILAAALESETETAAEKQEKCRVLMQAIDDLLIQL
ncbi:HEAT repeat domain-containing protein [[Phormidium] sp. ETS-05]|uniref:HEAT repeat domain-containing protein n=1 Tax=[Phormidium] sp. ETS-05 TaxID=222819 RepID=UPI001E42DDF0|nr:HEAT repeat domain-containing protein [[Phormidium] sp. ETS-05]